MASCAIYFRPWKLNPTGWIYLLCSPDYCTRPCLPPARSPFITRCRNIALCLDGNQQCSLTYPSWATSSRRKLRASLASRRCAGYALKLSHRPQQ
eukprot:9502851-Pyramimonas_sp.AAC.1